MSNQYVDREDAHELLPIPDQRLEGLDFYDMEYSELQHYAKMVGIRANLSTEKLQSALERVRDGELVQDELFRKDADGQSWMMIIREHKGKVATGGGSVILIILVLFFVFYFSGSSGHHNTTFVH
jgi:hypothetical protein